MESHEARDQGDWLRGKNGGVGKENEDFLRGDEIQRIP